MMIPPRIAHTTRQGRRRTNQDSVLAMLLPDGRQLLALADGIGGQRSGEVASTMATQLLATELAAGKGLLEASLAANHAIFEASIRDPACAGMGTTLVALLRSGSKYEIVNVGDSRAYRIDRDEIRQITQDHSFAADAARAGQLLPEEIARSPWRNALTRSVGTSAEVDVDVYGPFEQSGLPHAILLCSDGLHGVLPDVVMRDRLLSARDLDVLVEDLALLALEYQSRDNISVIVVEFGSLFGAEGMDEEATTGAGPAKWKERVRLETTPDMLRSGSSASTVAGPAQPERPPAVRARRRRSRGFMSMLAGTSEDTVLFTTAMCGVILWFVLTILAA